MRVTNIVATVFFGISAVMAAPTGTEGDLAPRAYASGSTSCYSQCPPTVDGYTYYVRSDATDYFSGHPYHECYYRSDSEFDKARCAYNDDGSLYSQFGTSNCPEQAPAGTCGTTNPDPDTQFKRRSVPRKRTKAERAIQARQYKPQRTSST